mgnify:FL=1
MFNSEEERERERGDKKATRCYKFSICLFMSPILNPLQFFLSHTQFMFVHHHPLFRILIVRYAFFVCVCVSFKKQQKDNTIRRYGNKNIFFLQTEHRLMTMAAWAIKSRIFTSLKRALNFVETFFYGNFTSDWNFKQFPAPFLFMNEKVDFSTRIDSCFYWVPFELLNLFRVLQYSINHIY